jgi:hypothetical protein
MIERVQALILIAVVGCHSASEEPRRSGPTSLPAVDPTTPDGFCHGYLTVLFERDGFCSGISGRDDEDLLGDPWACERFSSEVRAGRIKFEPTLAGACLQALAGGSFPCEPLLLLTGVAACREVATAAVPLGGGCQSFNFFSGVSECAGGAYCRDGASSCMGVCTALIPVAQDCDPNTDRCAEDARCDLATKRCVPRPPEAGPGQACGGASNVQCRSGSYCVFPRTASGVCRATTTSGSCSRDGHCSSGTRCLGPEGQRRCAPPKKLGEPCTAGWNECSASPFGRCEGGVCTERRAEPDQPCAWMNGEFIHCVAGAYCDQPTSGPAVCRRWKSPGEPCAGLFFIRECDGNGGHCDQATHRCVACDL